MSRRQVAETCAVQNERGDQRQVRLINVHSTGVTLGGGETITDSYFELDDGSRIDGDLDNSTFWTADRSVTYKRV